MKKVITWKMDIETTYILSSASCILIWLYSIVAAMFNREINS